MLYFSKKKFKKFIEKRAQIHRTCLLIFNYKFFVTSWSAFFFLFLTLSRDSLKIFLFLCSKYLHIHSLVSEWFFLKKYFSFCAHISHKNFNQKTLFFFEFIFLEFLITKSNILFVIFVFSILNSSCCIYIKWNRT